MTSVNSNTTIKLYLPRADQRKDVLMSSASAPIAGGAETILVAAADLAVDPDMTARLFDESIDHRQAETGSLSFRLRRKEGLEGLRYDFGEHAGASIRDSQHHVLAGRNVMCVCILVVQRCVSRLNCQLAGSVHGIACVDSQVQKGVLDLRGINERVPKTAVDDSLDLDAFADCTAKHVVDTRHEPSYVDDLRLQRSAASERRQLARQLRAPADAGQRIRNTPLGTVVAGDIFGEELRARRC